MINSVKFLKSADLLTTVVCFPLGQYLEEEDTDRAELALPGDQLQLLKDAIYYSKSLSGSSVSLSQVLQ